MQDRPCAGRLELSPGIGERPASAGWFGVTSQLTLAVRQIGSHARRRLLEKNVDERSAVVPIESKGRRLGGLESET